MILLNFLALHVIQEKQLVVILAILQMAIKCFSSNARNALPDVLIARKSALQYHALHVIMGNFIIIYTYRYYKSIDANKVGSCIACTTLNANAKLCYKDDTTVTEKPVITQCQDSYWLV